MSPYKKDYGAFYRLYKSLFLGYNLCDTKNQNKWNTITQNKLRHEKLLATGVMSSSTWDSDLGIWYFDNKVKFGGKYIRNKLSKEYGMDQTRCENMVSIVFHSPKLLVHLAIYQVSLLI